MKMPPPIPTSPESTPANIPKLRLPRNDFTRTSVAHYRKQFDCTLQTSRAGRLKNLLALACHNFQYLSFTLLQYSALPVQCGRIKGCDGGTFGQDDCQVNRKPRGPSRPAQQEFKAQRNESRRERQWKEEQEAKVNENLNALGFDRFQ